MTLDLAALRKLCEAATDGPWRISMSGYSVKSQDDNTPIVCAVPGGASARAKDVEAWLDNAIFIVTARSALPALIDRVEALEVALREALRFAKEIPTNTDAWQERHDGLKALAALVTK